MRVRFLLGPAGSGKTYRCLAEIRERLTADPLGPPLVLLAPRQATYQLELELLARPGLAGYTRLQIVSFERFALWLMEALRRPVREVLSEEGRVMVLRALAHQCHDQLRVFRDSSRLAGFARLLSEQLQEFQQQQLTATALRRVAERVEPGAALSDKLRDLALLLEKYQEWLGQRNLPDSGSLLDQAAHALRSAGRERSNPALNIAGLWLDGMAELTAQELELITLLPPFCDEATLAFCLEGGPKPEESWLSTWSVISQTFRRCHGRLAAREDCQIEVEVLPRNERLSRFADSRGSSAEVLRRLEAGWTTGVAGDAGAPAVGNPLRLVSCAGPEQEAVNAAREILRFVQEGNRFRDCAVLLRQLDTHYAGLRRAFNRYEIPFFLDRRESIAHHPLAEFTRSALHTVLFHWRFSDWFAALKTGLAGLAPDAVDRLENVALAKGWEGNAWLRPVELPEEPALALECESVRRRTVPPFERLRGEVSGEPGGRQLARALRRFWNDFRVEQTLDDWAAGEGDRARHLTVFEELSRWLDNLERAFGDHPLPLREWLPILEAGFSVLTVGVIPPAIDQVLIGAVDRSRNPDLKFALVLGMNEGVFPLPPPTPGLLTESDRAALEGATLSLSHATRARLGRERYLGYIALTRARERLLLSWSERDAKGRVLNPSPFVDQVRRMFPAVVPRSFDELTPLEDCIHPRELLEAILAVRDRAQIDPETLSAAGLWERIRHFEACDASYRAGRLSSAAAAALYGSRLRTSASRLEQFAACPFEFFTHAGLRARERDRFEVDRRKTGTFLHEVLREFHEELLRDGLRWRDVPADEAGRRIARIAGELRSRVAGGVLASHPRHLLMTESLTALLQDFVATMIGWMQAYQFDPLAVELAIGGEGGTLPWWEIDLGEGRTLAFRGSVDRVDSAILPGQPDRLCLAVVDYKSGNKRFEPLKMQAGLQLQLPAYLAALCDVAENSEWLQGRRAIPAGMFYVRLKDDRRRLSHRDAGSDPKDAGRFQHTGRFSFELLPLFDSKHGAGGSGQFSYQLRKDGRPYASSKQLVSQGELESMLAGAREIIRTLGREILAGNIAVDPYRSGAEIPCTHCEFKPVCRIDPWTHSYRSLQPVVTG